MKRLSPLFPLLITGALAGPVHARNRLRDRFLHHPDPTRHVHPVQDSEHGAQWYAMQILETNSTEGYTRSNPEGTVGWILTAI